MADEKKIEISDEEAQKLLDKGKKKAEETINDVDKFERLLQRIERKLKLVPIAGTTLAIIPTMISLVKSYVQKEYTDIPIGSVIAIVSALIYFVSPIDLIPDNVPVIGYIDDMTVITVCLKMVQSDIDEYLEWREKNGKNIE
ncbi:YkvA family protein [Butyrivibrio sp. XBB1001]|uniref:YkvA family protein n=1 Tax=Butyrivibrio sp. XBB1001 TaxID=1280682 RepID=UPI0003F78CAD|nr:DUF1232 domain-containing protein [Butyrivibrio sp. XBB1001]